MNQPPIATDGDIASINLKPGGLNYVNPVTLEPVGPPWSGTHRNDCIDCSACLFGDDANNARCDMVPDNIDFGWSAGKIAFGRWISAVDHFEPCRSWQGPCTITELRDRAKAIAAYRQRIEEGYRDWKSAPPAYVDRAAEALASAEAKDARSK